jgi:hypothetical protein
MPVISSQNIVTRPVMSLILRFYGSSVKLLASHIIFEAKTIGRLLYYLMIPLIIGIRSKFCLMKALDYLQVPVILPIKYII